MRRLTFFSLFLTITLCASAQPFVGKITRVNSRTYIMGAVGAGVGHISQLNCSNVINSASSVRMQTIKNESVAAAILVRPLRRPIPRPSRPLKTFKPVLLSAMPLPTDTTCVDSLGEAQPSF